MNKLTSIILVFFALLLVGSCARETQEHSEVEALENTTIKLSLSLSRTSGSEQDMRTLRIIIFRSTSSGGELVAPMNGPLVNELITLSPSGEAKFERKIPMGYLNIYLVANENFAGIGSLTGLTTAATLRTKVASYDALAKLPASPFLMYGEYKRVKLKEDGTMSIDGEPLLVDASGATEMKIERTIAKVQLNLSCRFVDLPISNSSVLSIERIAITNLPKSPYLIANQEYIAASFYEDVRTMSGAEFVSIPGERGFKTKEGIVLYIPEHLIANKDNKTTIEIWGKVDGTSNAEPWKIILGDRIKETGALLPDDLELPAYRILRNTHYNIDAKIKSLPGYSGIEMTAEVADWELVTIDNEL